MEFPQKVDLLAVTSLMLSTRLIKMTFSLAIKKKKNKRVIMLDYLLISIII